MKQLLNVARFIIILLITSSVFDYWYETAMESTYEYYIDDELNKEIKNHHQNKNEYIFTLNNEDKLMIPSSRVIIIENHKRKYPKKITNYTYIINGKINNDIISIKKKTKDKYIFNLKNKSIMTIDLTQVAILENIIEKE